MPDMNSMAAGYGGAPMSPSPAASSTPPWLQQQQGNGTVMGGVNNLVRALMAGASKADKAKPAMGASSTSMPDPTLQPIPQAPGPSATDMVGGTSAGGAMPGGPVGMPTGGFASMPGMGGISQMAGMGGAANPEMNALFSPFLPGAQGG